MADFFEIDFLSVESPKSGDAICLRYEQNGQTFIHVVDAGFQATGESVATHIKSHYGNPVRIDHVVATHPDGDHAGGLRTILQEFEVGTLWMLRPWIYASEIIPRFKNYNSVEHLQQRLRAIYPNLAALEGIANEKNIPIREPFQGATIGAFHILAPSKGRYLDLVVESEKTPEHFEEPSRQKSESVFEALLRKGITIAKAMWGMEVFSSEETSNENEMSVVQYANLCDERILLTADAGRRALTEAADYAPFVGLRLPGLDRVQVPHHGSRRNVSTEVLDRLLGPRLPQQPPQGSETFTAVISSAKEDEDHPRKSVIRAFAHRGAKVLATEGISITTFSNAPTRLGWGPVTPLPYPTEQEED